MVFVVKRILANHAPNKVGVSYKTVTTTIASSLAIDLCRSSHLLSLERSSPHNFHWTGLELSNRKLSNSLHPPPRLLLGYYLIFCETLLSCQCPVSVLHLLALRGNLHSSFMHELLLAENCTSSWPIFVMFGLSLNNDYHIRLRGASYS